MKQKTQARGNIFLTISYSLAAVLVMAVLILVVILIATGHSDDSPFSNTHDYAAAEKTIWSVEELPTPESYLNPDTAGFVKVIRYTAEPQKTVGEQTIALSMQLADDTIRTENAKLIIRDANLQWELGTPNDAATLLGADCADAVINPPLSEINGIGTYSVDVTLANGTFPFTVVVQDTVAPEAKLRDKIAFGAHQQPTEEDFLESVSDASEVTIAFSPAPDTETIGDNKTTKIVITDAAGNVTTLDATYAVTGDVEKPVFEGIRDLTTIEGCPLSYTHNVKAVDAVDGEVSILASEDAGFSIKTAGEYSVTYTAKDAAGNTATQTAKVTVLPKDTDLTKIDAEMFMLMVYRITDELFADAGELSEKEKAWKCYRYVQDHMYFKDNNTEYPDLDKDWIYPAALAIRQKYGDCRNYYGFARLLYTCAGIENLMVYHPANYQGADRHWWNMIRIDGNWWHADPTPRVGISNFFMKSDAWMDSYSAKNGGCFKRDKSLYPATPTE